MAFWLAIGPKENWEIAFEKGNIWGLTYRHQKRWEKVSEGDRVFFYVTSPIKGIIGYGTINSKFIGDEPLWPEELKENGVIWPFRFKFDLDYCLTQDKWATHCIEPGLTRPLLVQGFPPLYEDTASQIINSLKQNLS